jgi:hypothetical protein
MFNLEQSIENWRNELAAQPNLATDDRRELETHLRDAIAGFQQRGLNDEESFWLARRRVGQPQQLVEEFVKADPNQVWRERVFWMTVGVLGWWLLGLTIYSVEVILGWIIPAWRSFNDRNFVWLEPLQVCAVAALFASGWFFNVCRHFEWFIQKRLRLVVSYIGLMSAVSLLWAEVEKGSMTWWEAVWQYFFINLVLGSGFLLLLVWLMPTQNRKTPKRA